MKFSSIVGLTLSIVGAILMVISGILGIMSIQQLENLIQGYGLDRDLFSPFLDKLMIAVMITLIFGIIGLSMVVLGFLKQKIGFILISLVGLITVLGLFIRINPPVDLGSGVVLPPLSLSNSFLLIDPFLILLGGIVGVISISTDRTKKRLKTQNLDHSDKSEETSAQKTSYQIQPSDQDILDKINKITLKPPLSDYNQEDLRETVFTAYNLKQDNENISDDDLLRRTRIRKPFVSPKIITIAVNLAKKLRFKPEYLTKEIQEELDIWDNAEN
jgi:hypothetical protein